MLLRRQRTKNQHHASVAGLRATVICASWLYPIAPAFGILRQVIGNFVPGRTRIHERMTLGANPRIIVEGSHADRHFRAVRPIPTKQTGTTPHAECFYCALAFSIHFDQLRAPHETELFYTHPRLRTDSRARMFSADRNDSGLPGERAARPQNPLLRRGNCLELFSYLVAACSSSLNAPTHARSCQARASSHSELLRQPE